MSPSSWWFASTACPLLAGTFGPLANGFSICALALSWRDYIPDGGSESDGMKIPDPHWALAINGVSLAFALIGNGALLANMAQRLRFTIAQPITIFGFFIAGVLLIAIMSAFNASPDYLLTTDDPKAIPAANHALTSAYYYAIFAAGLYLIIAGLLCLTVYGARKGHYKKEFNLTPAQRTLMLQTMSFIAYLLLGALVFSTIEDWEYLDAVYWADITLLTIGLGDITPKTNTGRGLLFPFALGGILIIGLVIGSIRSLVLERGREKMSARIVEKRRETAVNNVDEYHQTIRISWFARARFSTDPALSPSQRREEEFNVMRKVQKIADRERRYFSLALSLFFVLVLWFIGALVFSYTEVKQSWTYFESLYFTFVVLLTIGYGDFSPISNSGRAFFVLWSILAVPSLTILISNMGDTIVKGFSDFTTWVGALTVLPDEKGIRATLTTFLKQTFKKSKETLHQFTPPGLLGMEPMGPLKRVDSEEHWNSVLDRLAHRLNTHLEEEELRNIHEASEGKDEIHRDMQFYHYVLSRECRDLQKNLDQSPPTQYSWGEWEYFLRLMGNSDEADEYPGQRHPNIMAPEALTVHHRPGTSESQGISGDPSDNAAPVTASASSDKKDSDVSDKKDSESSDKKDSASLDDEDSKHIEWDDALDNLPQNEGDRQSGLPLSEATTLARSDTDGDGNTATRRTRSHGIHSRSRSRSRHRHHHKRKHRGGDDDPLCNWSWLSSQSPLMSNKTESRWILDRLSAALERELNRQRKGYKKTPPISMRDIERINIAVENVKEKVAHDDGDADAEADAYENQRLAQAARG